jgi:HAD superfamily hydrolase (TIGR01509 family)
LKAHGLDRAFDRVWAYGDYTDSEPSPAPYLQAMKDWNVAAPEVLVFEDSIAGMESAHQAGLKWVQVCFEAHAQARDPRSTLVIRDWNDLKLV